jgi:hypothetical protein
MKEYQDARAAEDALAAELRRVERIRETAAILCAYTLVEIAEKRVRASAKHVRTRIDEFTGATAEWHRVGEQLGAASAKRRELAQLNFDEVFRGPR